MARDVLATTTLTSCGVSTALEAWCGLSSRKRCVGVVGLESCIVDTHGIITGIIHRAVAGGAVFGLRSPHPRSPPHYPLQERDPNKTDVPPVSINLSICATPTSSEHTQTNIADTFPDTVRLPTLADLLKKHTLGYDPNI